jgi:hypothetical protein
MAKSGCPTKRIDPVVGQFEFEIAETGSLYSIAFDSLFMRATFF